MTTSESNRAGFRGPSPESRPSSLRPRVSLICVGSELLRGKINTHASTLATRLGSIGLELSEDCTVPDDLAVLVRVIREGFRRSEIVVVTGGLGPTFDDITREAAAQALDRPLVFSKRLMSEIQKKFKKAGYRRMPPANRRQAQLIKGATAIPNTLGTAPGQWVELARKGAQLCAPTGLLILLPGPPSELIPMLDGVIPRLKKAFPSPPTAEAHLHFVGMGESMVDHKIRPIIAAENTPWGLTPRCTSTPWGQTPMVSFTILAHLGLVDFDIFVTAASRANAEARLRLIVGKIRKKMGRAIYGINDAYPLEKVVGDAFRRARATLAVAESCTGGLLAKTLTDVPGSSAYFLGGVVSYHNAVKSGILNVSPELLKRHGAVSQEAAAAMAKGIRQETGSTWGIGITGIAGPGGGTKAKPVGLVYVGLAGPRGGKTVELHLRGSRGAIRQRAVIAALDLLRQIYL